MPALAQALCVLRVTHKAPRCRALDFGRTPVCLKADAPHVRCARHGVDVTSMPWVRHGSSFTVAFEGQDAWITVNASKSAVAALMRISWRTVGWICRRLATGG